MAASGFDKDFGYLMPFLEKIAEAANSIADPAAREELKRLVAGEQSKWHRIQELLSGAAAKPAQPVYQSAVRNGAVVNGAVMNAKVAGGASAQSEAGPTPVRQFTVGSLRPR